MADEQFAPDGGKIYGSRDIPVTIDGFLRATFTRDGFLRAQVYLPSDDIQVGAWQVVDVDRRLVRAPPMVRGPRI